MSDTSDNDIPTDGAPPSAAPRKLGLLDRLFRLGASNGGDLKIAIAPFFDPAGQDQSRALQAAFANLDNVRARTFRDKAILNPETDRAEHLPAACAQAMGWIGKHNADLVLWGDIPPPGTTYYIYFAAPPPMDADPAGTISPFQALTLPVGFDPEDFSGLLLATALAAMNVEDDVKTQNRRALVADALERATTEIERIPSDFTIREQASVQAAYANALASFGHLFPGGEAYQRAAQAYAKALKGTPRSDSPTNWAYLQRNLGTVLQALGERSDDIDTLEQAVAAYRAALEVFTFKSTPFPWATTSNRLGAVLYRLDNISGDTAGLKEALQTYQGALKVLSRKSTPLLWAETLNNLGQTAQLLGRELSNQEVIERAITAFEQALKVRKRAQHPTLWAATQNNMGSALFSLGRMTGDERYYEGSLRAFMGAREIYESLGLKRMVEVTDKNIHHAEARLPEGGATPKQNDPAMWWLEEDEDDSSKS